LETFYSTLEMVRVSVREREREKKYIRARLFEEFRAQVRSWRHFIASYRR
jgi:hypothetical protein